MTAQPVNPRYANVTEADVRAAQTAVDAWAEGRYPGREDAPFSTLTGASLLELRGIIAVQLADMRWAGYQEGKVEGRRAVAREVRELLEGEGL